MNQPSVAGNSHIPMPEGQTFHHLLRAIPCEYAAIFYKIPSSPGLPRISRRSLQCFQDDLAATTIASTPPTSNLFRPPLPGSKILPTPMNLNVVGDRRRRCCCCRGCQCVIVAAVGADFCLLQSTIVVDQTRLLSESMTDVDMTDVYADAADERQ